MRNNFKLHKMSVLSALLCVLAMVFGADAGFAMAIDPVELAPEANPSENMNVKTEENPGGRPADEALQTDEQGGKTQLQGKTATATDVRDAGLEAEDYDKDVDEFRSFAFPIETYIARKCRPVPVKSPIHGHFRTGSTDLTAVYTGAAKTITAGQNTPAASGTSTPVYSKDTKVLALKTTDFENVESMREFSTVVVKDVEGYEKSEEGAEIPDGELMLFVLDHKDGADLIKFLVVNPPIQEASGSGESAIAATSVTIPTNAEFYVCAPACSESQMRVAPETFLPERFDVYLQKKITTCVITDAMEEQIKKVPHTREKILANAEYNFKRKCARSHWIGRKKRIQVWVPEIQGREDVFMENGIIRQLNMLYTLNGDGMTDDDLLAISTLQFTDNSQSDDADVFCGKKAIQRVIKLVNSADKYKDVGKVEVNDYGIKIRRYRDNFGTLNFIYDPTLNDIGYEDAMVVVDLKHATRPYIHNDKSSSRDMSKTGEAREAKEYNLCRYDCVALNGFNSILVVPANMALSAAKVGGIQAQFVSVAELPSGNALTAEAKTKKYYLTADNSGFAKGDVVEWDKDLEGWVKFKGLIRNAA